MRVCVIQATSLLLGARLPGCYSVIIARKVCLAWKQRRKFIPKEIAMAFYGLILGKMVIAQSPSQAA